MIYALNGVEKGRPTCQAAVLETLMGVSRWCSTSTPEGLALTSPHLEVLAGDQSPRCGLELWAFRRGGLRVRSGQEQRSRVRHPHLRFPLGVWKFVPRARRFTYSKLHKVVVDLAVQS